MKNSKILTSILLAWCCLFFSFYESRAEDIISWGNPTNGLRAGLGSNEKEIRINSITGKLTEPAFIIEYISTNRTNFRWKKNGQKFALKVLDSNGRLVQRTAKGNAFREFSDANKIIGPKQWRRQDFPLVPTWPTKEQFVLDLINPYAYFILTNPGNYRLVMDVRVFMQETNGVLRSIMLPSVTMPIRVE